MDSRQNQTTLLDLVVFPPKSDVITALTVAVEQALETAERAQAVATNEATSEESKSEGKYDTRATEASYLARGQAERVVEMRELLSWFRKLDPQDTSETVRLGSFVGVGGQRQELVFICPVGGGATEVHGVEVKTISLASPLGRAMRGLSEGDDFELVTPAGTYELQVEHLL
jgi:transcription elongation GreA/GreB family factor